MGDIEDKTVLFESMYGIRPEKDDTVALTESTDREALLALMYDTEAEDEAEEGPKPERPNGIMNMPKMSSEIRRLNETIESQNRMIKRINQRLRKLERVADGITRDVTQLGTEIDAKVDRSFR